MSLIKDSTKTTLSKYSIDLQPDQHNFKILQPEEAKTHLTLLAYMLTMLTTTVSQKLPNDGGNNPELLSYLGKLTHTLNAIVLKHRFEALNPNKDIRLSCAIDPSDSGFPIFVRDFKFLNTDKADATEELAKLPDNKKMVDDALFFLFRGYFPKNIIFQKLARNYNEMLLRLTMPESLYICPDSELIEGDDFYFCKQSFERLDEQGNIPRFYTLYLKIPSKTYYYRPEWQDDLIYAIQDGLSTVTELEMGYLAKIVEDVEGIQLEYMERFDIGPFYTIYTDNDETIASLIHSEDDSIMMFQKIMVVRTSEKKRKGFTESIKAWWSGDYHIGNFSPVIESPQYILMSHRLVQKVHNLNLTLKKQSKMFGITNKGEIYE